MSVEKAGLASPLQELLQNCPPAPLAEAEKTAVKDVFNQDHVLRMPTLPPKLPEELEDKFKELSKKTPKCPDHRPDKVRPDMKWFPTLPPTLPPELVDPSCPRPEKPPVLFDMLDPKFRNKKDDTRLA